MRLWRRRGALLVEEISATLPRHVRRVHQPHEGRRSLAGVPGERPDERHRRFHDEAVVPVEAGRHEAWVKAVRGDARPLEPAGQLRGEQDVGELRLAVALEPAHPPGPVAVEVVEGDALLRRLMRIRRRRHDASRSALLQPVEEQRRQQERREVVHRPCQLDAVLGEDALLVDRAGVVHEDVDPRIPAEDVRGQLADGCLR